ncbi:hypothetical protein [Paenibacillus sp. Leaf72]|uniref:hypothetical protein n=1 Tax=Paenibacillus sp. Leaf72 TaxID=1736234 RepID=UPI00071426F8|nr:hypothetical protein [Paenibacillus sp. Leaf72]KQN96760.1 hypothetical protein ASF12_22055 [Paenibacillus sp. Leaf72]
MIASFFRSTYIDTIPGELLNRLDIELRLTKSLNAVIALVDKALSDSNSKHVQFVQIEADIEIRGIHKPYGFYESRREWHSSEPQYWINTIGREGYQVCRLIEEKIKIEEVIDTFQSLEKAKAVCKALKEGYFYSKDNGIECYIERTERLYNS